MIFEGCVNYMKESYTAEFNTLYNKVFTPDGDIKPCGREMCKNLISLCDIITDTKDKYGDKEKGFMDVKSIKELKATLNN